LLFLNFFTLVQRNLLPSLDVIKKTPGKQEVKNSHSFETLASDQLRHPLMLIKVVWAASSHRRV
jgi:hypothetical protein